MHKEQRHMKTKGMQTYSWGPITWLLSRGRFPRGRRNALGAGGEVGDRSSMVFAQISQGFGAKKIELRKTPIFSDKCRYRLRSDKWLMPSHGPRATPRRLRPPRNGAVAPWGARGPGLATLSGRFN